ncbi:MAG: response regulator transcription factor [Fimbriimonadaceae bacterium]
MKILIVEDDHAVGMSLAQATSEAGFFPRLTTDGILAIQIAKKHNFDLILLDVMIPSADGFEVCKQLRSANISTPILILTAKDLLEDKIKGLDCGADDYLVKPFQFAELLARMRAILRRQSGTNKIIVADLDLELRSHQISRNSTRIDLSATEYALLAYLMQNAGRVLTRSMLMHQVWQYDFDGNDNVLDVYISYLRKKIDTGRDKSLITTVRGIGYRLESE